MKTKSIILLVALFGYVANTSAQKYITKTGQIEIFSETPVFTIEAVNKKVASILNIETGEVVVSTLVRSFDFEEALVEEHFNENYIESHKFPKSTFKGKIKNLDAINFSKDGVYPFQIVGDLTIHGVTKNVTQDGSFTIADGKINAKIDFIVSLQAYEVKVEKAYKDAIKDEIELEMDFDFLPMAKK